MRFLIILLSLCVFTGPVHAEPPRLGEDESFESFRDRWNAWVESLSPDEIMIDRLRDIRDRIISPYNLEFESYWVGDVISAEPNGYGWHLTPRVFEDHREYFEQLDEVARRPYFGCAFPDHETGFGDSPTSPERVIESRDLLLGNTLRRLCLDLMLWGQYLAHHGEMDAAIERFDLVVQLSERFEDMPSLLGYLSRFAVGNALTDILMGIVETSEVLEPSDEQLAEIQRLLHRSAYPPIRPTIVFHNRATELDWRANAVDGVFDPEFERVYREIANGMMSHVFEPDPPVMSDLDPHSIASFAPPDEQCERVRVLSDALFADLDAFPGDQSICRLSSELMKQFEHDHDGNRFIPAYIQTSIWRSLLDMHFHARYKLRNNLVITAIHRYRFRNGHWPETLDVLDDEILPVPAIDLYNGEPLRYRVSDYSPRLWAMGVDRDDDLSQPIPEQSDDKEPGIRHTWISINEWDSMSTDQRSKYDGDIQLMY